MSKIKVAHIITRLDRGGSSENVLLNSIYIDKTKFDISVIFGLSKDPLSKLIEKTKNNNVKFIEVSSLRRNPNFFFDVSALVKLIKIIKKENFDIVHTHSSKAGLLSRWAAKLAGVKIIVHSPHGHIFYGYFGWFKTKLFILLERLSSLVTDKILTMTQRGKEEHIKYRIAKPDKFIPIYSGIEIEKFNNFQIDIAKRKEKLNIPLDVPVIGTVSRLEPIKGNRYFIMSLPDIVKVFPALRVLIVGDGSQRKKLEQDVKNLNLSGNVIFLGQFQDIRSIVSIFNVFVLTSLNEGMGRCLLEAQALGIPVVATKVGGIPEVVRDGITGTLVPARNPKAASEAIINLLKNKPLRENMSKEAKKWIDKSFSAEAMVKKTSDLYQELIEKKAMSHQSHL